MGRVKVGFSIDEQVDRALSHLSVDLKARKSELYELGARLVIALAKVGYVPDDCSVIEAVEPGLVERLQELLRRATGRREPQSAAGAAAVEAEVRG